MEGKKTKQNRFLKTVAETLKQGVIFIKKNIVFGSSLVFITIFINPPAFTQNSLPLEYSVEGTIDWVKKGKVYLSHEDDLDSQKINVSAITDGHFVLKGNFAFSDKNKTELVYIIVAPYKDKIEYASRLFYLEPLKINVSIKKESPFIIFDFEGSEIQKKYTDYWTELMKYVKDTLSPLRNRIALVEQDSTKKEQLLKLQDSLKEKKHNLTAFVMQHAEANKDMEFVYINASVNFQKILESERGREFLTQLCVSGQNNFPESERVSDLCNAVASIDKISPGKKAPEFSLPNPKNKLIELSSLRGKYLLIDFWASWCKPCRAEYPELKKLYEKYRTREFGIMGVSIDRNKKHWTNAIEKEDIDWLQVIDINSKIMADYNINAVPFNILLDKNGDIVAIDLHGVELDKKLEELFP